MDELHDATAALPRPEVRERFVEEQLKSDKFTTFAERYKAIKIRQGDKSWADDDEIIPQQGSEPDPLVFEDEDEKFREMMREMGLGN